MGASWWHFSQATAMWAPTSGNRVFACSASAPFGRQSFMPWHSRQSLPSCDRWMSVWQPWQPRATYSRPEIASVGLTEQQCQERGLPTKVAKIPFQAIGKAIIGGEYEGFAKIIGHRDTDETLGIHLIGPHATDLVAEASLALSLEATPWEIGATTHAHPTYSEILGETAMAVDGRSINF